MARRKNIVIEDATPEMLKDERDAQRRVLNRMVVPFEQELDKRARKHVDSGDYAGSMFAEVADKELSIRGGSDDPKAHIMEYGTGPRTTSSGANRGIAPKFGVIRKSALAIRRRIYSEMVEELKRV